jgi:hypothetical protein
VPLVEAPMLLHPPPPTRVINRVKCRGDTGASPRCSWWCASPRSPISSADAPPEAVRASPAWATQPRMFAVAMPPTTAALRKSHSQGAIDGNAERPSIPTPILWWRESVPEPLVFFRRAVVDVRFGSLAGFWRWYRFLIALPLQASTDRNIRLSTAWWPPIIERTQHDTITRT